MLGYATIGTKDMDRAEAFYDALLAEADRHLHPLQRRAP
jgi:catechol 2,3-dioxygenase-like lactoylglutathione lyase family enzyme